MTFPRPEIGAKKLFYNFLIMNENVVIKLNIFITFSVNTYFYQQQQTIKFLSEKKLASLLFFVYFFLEDSFLYVLQCV